MHNKISNESFFAKSCLTLLESYHSPAWVRCIEGKYLWVNEGFLKFFNVTKDQVIGKPNSDFLPLEITLKSYESEQEVLNKRQAITFHFDNNEYRTTVHKTPIFDENGEVVAISALLTDLTPILKAEEKLKETKDFYQSILANMAEALYFINADLKYEIINEKGKELISKIGIENPITYQAWFNFLSEQYKKRGKEHTLDNAITLRALKGEKILNQEVSISTIDEDTIVLSASAIPLKNKDNNSIKEAILTVTDITKEKEMLNKLDHKSKTIKQRNEELQHFAYSAAHDLRDPLRNMSLAACIMQEKLDSQNYEEIRPLLERLLNTASYGTSLVKNLLDYSNANREIELEKVNLTDVVEQNIATLSNLIEEAGATIVYSDLPCILGNQQQLLIVFQNLISNSIRYRGINLLKISITAKKKGCFWEISFQDNGPGIDEKYKEVIFQPFKRLGSNLTTRSSGLGLAICWRIIEQHGGKIWLDTNTKYGTCFKFILKGLDPAKES